MVDTWAWLALYHPGDQFHETALAANDALLDADCIFVTTNSILTETYTRSRMLVVLQLRAIPQYALEGKDNKRKSHSVKQADWDSYAEKFRETVPRGVFYLISIPYKMKTSYTELFRLLPVELSASRSQ